MSGFADERRVIEQRLIAGWTTTPIKFENTKFVQPTNTPWIALRILNGEGFRADLGGSTGARYRFPGVIVVQLFVPDESGIATARQYADTIATLFRSAQFSAGASGTITCRTPYVTTVGNMDGWHQLNLTIPFQRDIVA